jgi:hypothetical protein
MDNYFQIINYIIIPILSLIVIPVIRGLFVRINNLEQQMNTKITEDKALQLLSYHIVPLKEDLSEIKAQLTQIMTKLINDSRS